MRVEALSNSNRRKPPLQTDRKVVKWWVVDRDWCLDIYEPEEIVEIIGPAKKEVKAV